MGDQFSFDSGLHDDVVFLSGECTRMETEIERLQLSLAQVRAEQVKLMRWKRRWDELAEILEDPSNPFANVAQVFETMIDMESGVNPDA
ncbi:MAG: hypothetical protein GY743_24545, partial [Planctomycetaceae bacterium]|nr:hypothetical protein [Planctomycetaceae bacterium]